MREKRMSRTGKKVGIALGGILVCLLLVGGVLYATGTLQSWRDDRELSRACEGSLAGQQVRDALGSDDVGARDTSADGPGVLASCRAEVTGGGSGLSIQVYRGSRSEGAMAYLGRRGLASYSSPVSPLGTWPGVLLNDPEMPRASLWLRCRGDKDKSLLVTARLNRDSGGKAWSGDKRRDFAAAVTATSKKAADAFGCADPEGGSLTGLADDPRDRPVPISKATGTCAALRPHSSAAARAGLDHVWTTRSVGSAPVEDCVLATSDDPQVPGYWISAYYGPYAESFATEVAASRVRGERGQEKDGHLTWATAECPGTDQRALYVLRGIIADTGTTTRPGEVPVRHDSAALRADLLTAFARQSSERHHCGDLKTP
ncbi:hypothetical protein ABZ370_42800 [Streptomyces sp. NPDC005962]|uniref:hypothetical protein n=1 Tax=Streptomyces sp. NPDC005962 TaxID=3154466 RepID=UPI0033F90298